MGRDPAELETQRLQAHAEDVEIVFSRVADRAGQLMRLAEDLVGRLHRVGCCGCSRLGGRALMGRLETEPTTPFV